LFGLIPHVKNIEVVTTQLLMEIALLGKIWNLLNNKLKIVFLLLILSVISNVFISESIDLINILTIKNKKKYGN